MKITILDDYQHAIEKLACFELLEGQDVQILHETEKDPAKLASKIRETEILVLTRERTEIIGKAFENAVQFIHGNPMNIANTEVLDLK